MSEQREEEEGGCDHCGVTLIRIEQREWGTFRISETDWRFCPLCASRQALEDAREAFALAREALSEANCAIDEARHATFIARFGDPAPEGLRERLRDRLRVFLCEAELWLRWNVLRFRPALIWIVAVTALSLLLLAQQDL